MSQLSGANVRGTPPLRRTARCVSINRKLLGQFIALLLSIRHDLSIVLLLFLIECTASRTHLRSTTHHVASADRVRHATSADIPQIARNTRYATYRLYCLSAGCSLTRDLTGAPLHEVVCTMPLKCSNGLADRCALPSSEVRHGRFVPLTQSNRVSTYADTFLDVCLSNVADVSDLPCLCGCRLPHPRAVPPLLEGRNGSSSPDGADGTGSRRRGSSSERSTTTPHAEAPQPHQLWDDTAAALRTPPALDRPMQLPKGSLSQQLRPAGGASSGGSAAEARQAPQDPSPSTSQRQLNHLTEQPGSSAVAAMMDTDEAAGSGGDEKAPSGNQRKATPAGAKLAQHQRKRKASSPLTSVEESVDGEASTSSIGSEVSSASAYGWVLSLAYTLPPLFLGFFSAVGSGPLSEIIAESTLAPGEQT